MIRFIVILTLITISDSLTAQVTSEQEVQNVQELQCDEDLENVQIEKIADDSLSSSFVIWVKDHVKPHYHRTHTEQVYVISGEGAFTLDGTTFQISQGDFIKIPKGKVHSVVVTSEEPLKVISIQTPQFFGEDRHFVID